TAPVSTGEASNANGNLQDGQSATTWRKGNRLGAPWTDGSPRPASIIPPVSTSCGHSPRTRAPRKEPLEKLPPSFDGPPPPAPGAGTPHRGARRGRPVHGQLRRWGSRGPGRGRPGGERRGSGGSGERRGLVRRGRRQRWGSGSRRRAELRGHQRSRRLGRGARERWLRGG